GPHELVSAWVVLSLPPPVSAPVLIPSAASVGVNPGGSLSQTFTVRNTGFMAINDATVTLQASPPLTWVALGNSDLGTIIPGDARQFTIQITPTASVTIRN